MPNFEEFSLQIQDHFINKTYAEGLALADKHTADFPDNIPLVNYWRICLAARLKNEALANQILEDSLSAGIWYSESLLRQSPSLMPMQGQPRFDDLVQTSLQMQQNDPADALPMLVVRPQGECGPQDTPCPLILFLHGNTDSARPHLKPWQSAPQDGWILALPQSKYAMWAGAYGWADHESAAEEIEAHVQHLEKQYNIDPARRLIGGFSMGAEVALWLALTGRVQAQGFILLGPGGPFMDDISQWTPLLEKARGRDLGGTIIMGLEDTTIPQENIRKLVETLNEYEIHTELEEVPRLAHEYPEEFDTSLNNALDFIFG